MQIPEKRRWIKLCLEGEKGFRYRSDDPLCHKVSPSYAAVPNLFGTRDRFRGRQFFQGWSQGGGMVQAVMQAMGSDGERQMKFHSPAAHLLLCGRVPNTLWTNTGPRPGGWGPLPRGAYTEGL